MLKEKNTVVLLYLFSLLLISCNSKPAPEVLVHFKRYDQAVFSQNLPELAANYPDFTPFYLEHIVNIGTPSDSSTAAYLKEFTKTYRNNAYDSVQAVFPNMETIAKQLGSALGNYKAVFPTDSLPEFYTHFSGFNAPLVSVGNIVSVSLENYLGNSNFYNELGVYRYLRKGMYPNKIAVDIVKMLLLQKVASEGATDNLLSAMIYQGKVYYSLQQMFPQKTLPFLLNYTEEQEQWCKANEAKMWSFLIEQKHLFATNYRTIRSYIEPAPFTKGFPSESPGQTGVWIGYQIVKNYMNNTQTSLSQLLEKTDYPTILQQAAYNPE